jgi:hypothetical protein
VPRAGMAVCFGSRPLQPMSLGHSFSHEMRNSDLRDPVRVIGDSRPVAGFGLQLRWDLPTIVDSSFILDSSRSKLIRYFGCDCGIAILFNIEIFFFIIFFKLSITFINFI